MAGEPWLYPRIDSVALSGYRTPFITDVSPAVISSNWSGEVVTITGQNFTTPVTVKVNGLSAYVNRIDDTSLEVTLPSGLRPGVVAVEIQNGLGRTGYNHQLRLGVGQFLPLIQR